MLLEVPLAPQGGICLTSGGAQHWGPLCREGSTRKREEERRREDEEKKKRGRLRNKK